MAIKVEARVGIAGLTLTLKLYPLGVDTIANGAGGDSMTEESNRVGTYGATIAESLSGIYEAYCLSGSDVVFTGVVNITSTSGTFSIGEYAPITEDTVSATILATISAAAVALQAIDSAGNITIHRGDTLSIAITGLGNLSARSKLWFSVKDRLSDADASAILQITQDGLTYINGAAVAPASADGSITVDDQVAGDITIALAATRTEDLDAASSLIYDIQMLTTGGVVTTLTQGKVTINEDITRAIS